MDLSRFGPSVNPLAAALAGGSGTQPAGNPTSGGMSPEMRALLGGAGQGGLPGGPTILPPISPTPGAGTPNIAGGSGVAMPPTLGGSIPGGLPGGPTTPGTGLPGGVTPFSQYLNGPGGGVLPSSFTAQGITPLPTGDQTVLPKGLQGQGLGPMSAQGPMPANFQPNFDAENPSINPIQSSVNTPPPTPTLPIINNAAPSFGFGSLGGNPLGQFSNPKGA